MNKQEIDAWLKDLDERHEKQLWKEGIKWKEDYKKHPLYGETRSDLDTAYTYVVVQKYLQILENIDIQFLNLLSTNSFMRNI